jgi:hypothetical protein
MIFNDLDEYMHIPKKELLIIFIKKKKIVMFFKFIGVKH